MDGYLKGDLSEDDWALLQHWYDSFGESAEGIPGLDELGAQALKEDLDQRIRAIINPSNPVQQKQRFLPWKWMAAALWVGILGAVWLSLRGVHGPEKGIDRSETMVFSEVKTGRSEVKKVTLPDGSILFLNAHSLIRIPKNRDGKIREVFLDEGEAYFEVARDSLRPFVVQAQALRVEVLGTAFDVQSYQSLDDIKVAVKHGKVRVRDSSRVLAELTAKERLSYRTLDKKATVNRLENAAVDAWVRGSVLLEKVSFNELALALYNLYGVHMKSADPRTAGYHYNLHLRAERSLTETMDIICGIHHTTYRRTGNEITIYP